MNLSNHQQEWLKAIWSNFRASNDLILKGPGGIPTRTYLSLEAKGLVHWITSGGERRVRLTDAGRDYCRVEFGVD